MAGILQLRRGLKSTYISEGTNLAEAFFVTTAESGSISANNLIVGTSGSVGNDVITLAKLSLANKDNSYADYNSGSFWITGDYTGSNALIYDNLKVSGSVFIEEDLHLEGHLYLGSGSDGDIVKIQSEFSGSLVPDNDLTGSITADPAVAHFDLGSTEKRWRNIYLQRDVNSGSLGGALSGSNIDLTGQIKVDGLGRFGYVEVDDLVDNRLVIVGPSGRLEDDANLTYDGQDFRLTNSDFYQSGSGASFQFVGAGMDITGSISNYQLRVDNGIVFTNEFGTLANQSTFTWDGGTLSVIGSISASSTLDIDGHSTLASATVEDLVEDRIVIVDSNGKLGDDQYFTYDGNQFDIGQGEFTVQRLNGNTSISGSVQLHSTLNVDGQSTLASLNVEDLTDNRVVIVGAGGEIEDDGNFTFNGTELNIGTGNFTVQQGDGNTQILGTLDVDSQSTLSSLNVEDLTSGRVVLAGTSGEIEDSGNLTFDGTDLVVTGNITVTQNLTVQGDTTQLDVTNLNVEDKNILLASGAVDAAAANGGGITIDGADATLLYGSSDDSFTFNKLLKVNGNISGSSFNGTTLLSSSNENFADYSQSVDSRLDEIEGPMSTSLDSRLIEIFSTGSDHESRIDVVETTFATTGSNTFNGDTTISASLFISGGTELGGDIFPQSPQGATLGTVDKPFRELYLQSGSISIESDTTGDPSALISNVSGNLEISVGGMKLVESGNSFVAETGSFSYLSGSLEHLGTITRTGNTTITGSVDITGDYQINGNSFSSSLFESASISGSVIEFTKGDDTTQQVQIPKGLGYSGLGWARYDDTTYTTASAFTITDGNTDVLPCNASSSIETHLHSTVSFYTGSGQKIQAENDGDVYSVTVTFNMRAGSNPSDGDFVTLKLQSTSGTPYNRVRKDLFFVKNDTSWHSIHEVFQYYADTDFVTNGNQFKLTANGVDVDIADVILFIQRTQNHSQH